MRSFFSTFAAGSLNTNASPLVGNRSPSSSLMVVVLPDPLGPSSPKISPLWILRSRALSAVFFLRPQKSRYTFVRLRVSTTRSSAITRSPEPPLRQLKSYKGDTHGQARRFAGYGRNRPRVAASEKVRGIGCGEGN